MSLRYTIDNLKRMRETAGLGTLSMGVCAISGELVSSTPIPGTRFPGNVADYGGYLLGEGMTREAALYIANLHNWFPKIASALEGAEDTDVVGLRNGIQVLREQLDDARAEVEQLKAELEHEKGHPLMSEWLELKARLAAIDAAKAGDPKEPDWTLGERFGRGSNWVERETRAWGRQGWDAAAALRVELATTKGSSYVEGILAQAREEGRKEERERIAAFFDALDTDFAVVHYELRGHSMGPVLGDSEILAVLNGSVPTSSIEVANDDPF